MIRIRRDNKEGKITINIAKDCTWENVDETVAAIREQVKQQLETLLLLITGSNDFTEVKYDAEGNLHCKKAYTERGKPAKDKEGEE